jgi:hypothetical protein
MAKGFSLIEALVALSLLSLTSMAFLGLAENGSRSVAAVSYGVQGVNLTGHIVQAIAKKESCMALLPLNGERLLNNNEEISLPHLRIAGVSLGPQSQGEIVSVYQGIRLRGIRLRRLERISLTQLSAKLTVDWTPASDRLNLGAIGKTTKEFPLILEVNPGSDNLIGCSQNLQLTQSGSCSSTDVMVGIHSDGRPICSPDSKQTIQNLLIACPEGSFRFGNRPDGRPICKRPTVVESGLIQARVYGPGLSDQERGLLAVPNNPSHGSRWSSIQVRLHGHNGTCNVRWGGDGEPGGWRPNWNAPTLISDSAEWEDSLYSHPIAGQCSASAPTVWEQCRLVVNHVVALQLTNGTVVNQPRAAQGGNCTVSKENGTTWVLQASYRGDSDLRCAMTCSRTTYQDVQ